MQVNFPPGCTSEASRLSFTTKLIIGVLIPWRNSQVVGMTKVESESWERANGYDLKLIIADAAKRENRAIAEAGVFWNPHKPTHWVGNGVVYPPGLDQANEGSRMSFLIGLQARLYESGMDHDEMADLNDRMNQAKQDAVNTGPWNPTLGDIS